MLLIFSFVEPFCLFLYLKLWGKNEGIYEAVVFSGWSLVTKVLWCCVVLFWSSRIINIHYRCCYRLVAVVS
ncbi:hypothetical protein IMY05_001G0264100 [Salix suchowensis]|nr:hypothetical protein IMY05_001G0264100 [Salix suchowensis]